MGNRNALTISHVGVASLPTKSGPLELQNVLLVPRIKKILLSVSQLTKENSCTFEFTSNNFVIKDQRQEGVEGL